MSSIPIYVLMQQNIKNSYWVANILQGINHALLKYRDTLCIIDASTDDFSDTHCSIYKKPVLLVGSDNNWIDSNINMLLSSGAVPILVNACMLPMHRCKASGVVFELEEAMEHCIRYLKESGHGRIAFLGANSHSVADISKCRAFGDSENTYPASATIEDCVDSFIDILPLKKYNGVICSNDTVAIYLINTMRKKGYKLPDDCYIIGMGCSFLAANHSISVSSVMFNYVQMGEEAVELYRTILRTDSPCHYTVSLPCCFMPGASTGETQSVRFPIARCCSEIEHSKEDEDKYFDGSRARSIIELESIFQQCDKTDRQIIFALMREESIERIAESVYLTPRAIRYRINNFFQRYSDKSQSEFLGLLRETLN